MDGTRSLVDLRKATSIDKGYLSRLVAALREAKLIGPDEKHPKLFFSIPSNFIDNNLSTMVSRLEKEKLLVSDMKKPKLNFSIPPNFFESNAEGK